MAAIVAYRVFDLPWSPVTGEERRFRRILGVILLIFLSVGAVIPFMPVPERPAAPPALPERVVQLVLEQPKPVPKPKVEPRVERAANREFAPVPKPAPVLPKLDARQRAERAGVLQIKDQLEELRQVVDTSRFASTQNLSGRADGPGHAERSLLTAGVANGSRGINTAALSRGYGAGVGALQGQVTTQNLPLATESRSGDQKRRSGPGKKAARTQEEIELVFDRNKAALYAIYSRALRETPELQGKFVVQLTITPAGEVIECHVVSSELASPDLERKLVARIRMFRFEARDVESMTATKPIEFFPA